MPVHLGVGLVDGGLALFLVARGAFHGTAAKEEVGEGLEDGDAAGDDDGGAFDAGGVCQLIRFNLKGWIAYIVQITRSEVLSVDFRVSSL